jgi:hypothetical protein
VSWLLDRGLEGSDQGRLAAYRKLFESAVSPPLPARPHLCTNGGFMLGSPTFGRQVEPMRHQCAWKSSSGRPHKQDAGDQSSRLAVKRGGWKRDG